LEINKNTELHEYQQKGEYLNFSNTRFCTSLKIWITWDEVIHIAFMLLTILAVPFKLLDVVRKLWVRDRSKAAIVKGEPKP